MLSSGILSTIKGRVNIRRLVASLVKLELVNNDLLAIRVQVFVDCAHELDENLIAKICSQMVIDLPHFLVVCVMLRFQPLVPAFSTSFDR